MILFKIRLVPFREGTWIWPNHKNCNIKPCKTFRLYSIYACYCWLYLISHLRAYVPVCCRDVLATPKVGHRNVYHSYEVHMYIRMFSMQYIQWMSGCLSHCGKKENQTDHSNLPWHVGIACIWLVSLNVCFSVMGQATWNQLCLHTYIQLMYSYVRTYVC